MRSRPYSARLDGFLNLHKPVGPTSQQVVAEIRRALGVKVGHCGTLDPPAAGVLPLCLGAATRLSDFLHSFPKGYEVWATFGVATTTLDGQGEVTASQPQPALSTSHVAEALTHFQGNIQQVPPLFSAVHFHGRRLYHYARSGEPVQPPTRTVSIFRLHLLSFRRGDFPVARLAVLCSSGTYIRSLCRDLGQALGSPAHVSRLIRTRVGPFRLEHSVSLPTALREAREGDLARRIVPPQYAGLGLPTLCLEEDLAYEISHGNEIVVTSLPQAAFPCALPDDSPGGGWLLVNNPSGTLLALCEVQSPKNQRAGSALANSQAGGFLLRPRRLLLGAAGRDLQ